MELHLLFYEFDGIEYNWLGKMSVTFYGLAIFNYQYIVGFRVLHINISREHYGKCMYAIVFMCGYYFMDINEYPIPGKRRCSSENKW